MTWTRVAKIEVAAGLDKRGKLCGPMGQPRVRAYRRGKITGVYTPKRADEWREEIRRAWDSMITRACRQARFPLDGPIRVELEFLFEHPRLHYKRHGKSPNLRDDAPAFHQVRPDVDNLAKLVLDALAVDDEHPHRPWANDWRVSELRVVKRYCRKRQRQGVRMGIFEWRDGR